MAELVLVPLLLVVPVLVMFLCPVPVPEMPPCLDAVDMTERPTIKLRGATNGEGKFRERQGLIVNSEAEVVVLAAPVELELAPVSFVVPITEAALGSVPEEETE
ncbi:hypothetical protein C8Q70DRAFT_937929 [Cubamyces menziesii]|nr:hypothetical protein C8Q70DRAFT_937929 [Cubamyces menziesii]